MDDIRLTTISTEWNYNTGKNQISYAVYDTEKQEIVSRSFITDGTEKEITLPYGLAVNPETKEIYVCDATNYVTPGYSTVFRRQASSSGKSVPATFLHTSLFRQKSSINQ